MTLFNAPIDYEGQDLHIITTLIGFAIEYNFLSNAIILCN